LSSFSVRKKQLASIDQFRRTINVLLPFPQGAAPGLNDNALSARIYLQFVYSKKLS